MSNLIIVVIAILLATVTSVGVIYYGSAISQTYLAQAAADTLINEATNITSAADLHIAMEGRAPGGSTGETLIADLTTNGVYLKSAPAANWFATVCAWDATKVCMQTTVAENNPDAVCRAVNVKYGYADEAPPTCGAAGHTGQPCCVTVN